MESTSQFHGILEKYVSQHPQGKFLAQPFIEACTLSPDSDVFTRSNLPFHVAVSAIPLTVDQQSVVVIHHRALNKWICPGGHIEPGEQPFEAAKRELVEETPISNRDASLIIQDPIYIDLHLIPEQKKKNEPAHFHFKLFYLFQLSTDIVQESNDVKTIPISSLHGSGSPLSIQLKKIISTMNNEDTEPCDSNTL